MENLKTVYITTTDASKILGIKPKSAGLLARQGRIPAEKIANRWLIRRAAVEELAETYVPRVGRPRTKRKYTKRSPKWFNK